MTNDITGLGQLASSPAVTKGYDDLLSAPLQESGKVLTDMVKAFRLFTAPLQLLALAQDRLAIFCDSIRKAVPEERQIEAAPSIAIPVLLALRQTEDESPLIDLYLNLLRRAIDRDRVQEAHPAFAKLIEQMSPDEAVFMGAFALENNLCLNRHVTQHNSAPFDQLAFPDLINLYASHLHSLGLVKVGGSFADVTDFGMLFVKACVPPIAEVVKE
jgi:hypothetical protein